MLNDELTYFIENQSELVKQHAGKVLVLKDRQVVGVYNDVMEAYLEAQKRYPLGTFMLQPCEAGPEAYTVTISSQEIFAGV
jgi:hypothetical protein